MNASVTNRESGAVLLVALIMLLLISIVGVSAIQSTSMEERMAGNLYDRHTSFQAAEAALREGEDQVDMELSVASGALSLEMNGKAVAASYTIDEVTTYYNNDTSNLEAGNALDASGIVAKVVAQSDGISGERPVVLESTYVIEE